MDATGRALVGDVEDGAAEGLGRFEIELDRERDRVEGAHHHVVGHGAPEWDLFRGPILVGRDEAGQRFFGQVGFELVGHGGQLGGEAHCLRRRWRRADRESDEAAQHICQVACFGLTTT